MSSPHISGQDTSSAPLGALPTPLTVHTTASASTLPPADTHAAAIALATFSDSRPSTSHHDHAADMIADDDDDDQDGGISLADFQQFMETPLLPSIHDLVADDPFEPLQSMMQQIQAYGHPVSQSAYMAAQPVPTSHFSSSEHSLEPPPTLQEAHLSIQDKGSFAPITSFFHWFTPQMPVVPGLDLVQVPASIRRDDLQGDRYDCQGIDWKVRNTSRAIMRGKRAEYEGSKMAPSQREARKYVAHTPYTDNFLQFKRNNTTHRAFFPHFQLRNVLAATSRHDVYYAAGHRVFRTNAEGAPADVTIDLSKQLAPDGSITTIATHDDVLIAGAFEGEYAIANLSSSYGTACTFGRTLDYSADTKSKIVNHMHLFGSRRTYTPQAVLCSNDYRLRVLDCATNAFTHSFQYSAAVNCAATSPDGRLRVVVGDFQETLITNAETGRPFESLHSHKDDAFACAWADDGIHVATAAQDSTIVVWDARAWSKPLAVMKSELSVPRSLRFSPLGSGPRMLIAAEADDYINVINAQTFASKQVFDFFGPIGGTAFSPDGSSLFIANGERRFGGIIELERCAWAEHPTAAGNHTASKERAGSQRYDVFWEDKNDDFEYVDWVKEGELDGHAGVASCRVERMRRHVEFGGMVV